MKGRVSYGEAFKRGAVVFTLLCMPVCFVRAQSGGEDVFRFPLNAETLPKYQAICAALSARPTVKGVFTQRKTVSRLNRALDSSGNFIIDAERGIVWETLRPFPSTTAAGRDYLVQSSPGGTKTKLAAGGNEIFLRLSDTMSSVFSGNPRRLLENFDNYFAVSGTDPAGEKWTLGLVPREKAVRSFADRIVLEGDAVIRRIMLYEPGGDSIRYDLSEHTFPAALTLNETLLFSVD